MPSFASGVRRVGLALRILFDPVVRPGRLLGSDEDGEGAPVDGSASPCPPDSVLVLDNCPLCGGPVRTLVGEFNLSLIHISEPTRH